MSSSVARSGPASTVLRSIAWNYAGALYEAAAGLCLVAYVVRRVSVPEYGLLLLAISLCSLTYLLDLGLGNLLIQAYVKATENGPRAVSEILSTSFVTLEAVGSLGAAGVIGLAFFLPGPFHIPPQYVREAKLVFYLVAISTFIDFPALALSNLYESYQRFDRLNQLQFITTTIRIVLTIGLLHLGFGVVALGATQIVLTGVRLLGLRASLSRTVPGVSLRLRLFDWSSIRPLLSLGAWSALDNVVRQVANASDSFILGVFGSVHAVAIFGVGGKLPAQLTNMVTRGAVVMLPSLAKHHVRADKAELRRLFLDAQRLVFTGALPVVVLGSLCAGPLIHLWAGESYAQAATVMRWLLIAALSLALEYSADLVLYACGEVKQASIIASVEALANISVSLLLVFRYGVVGLAAGTALTHVIVNFFWYTPTACRVAGVRGSEFVKALFAGHTALLALLGGEVAVLCSVGNRFGALALVMFGVVAGVLYMGFWGATIVHHIRVNAAN